MIVTLLLAAVMLLVALVVSVALEAHSIASAMHDAQVDRSLPRDCGHADSTDAARTGPNAI